MSLSPVHLQAENQMFADGWKTRHQFLLINWGNEAIRAVHWMFGGVVLDLRGETWEGDKTTRGNH